MITPPQDLASSPFSLCNPISIICPLWLPSSLLQIFRKATMIDSWSSFPQFHSHTSKNSLASIYYSPAPYPLSYPYFRPANRLCHDMKQWYILIRIGRSVWKWMSPRGWKDWGWSDVSCRFHLGINLILPPN